jgi:hypothetical protein
MSISAFTTAFIGGTRKNRFRVKCNLPGFSPTATDPDEPNPAPVSTSIPGASNLIGGFDDFHVLAAAMPASIITTNPIDFRGRRILYPGDRVYSAEGFNVWTVTIQDDIPGQPTQKITNLWNRLHAWSNGINSHVFNTGTPFSSPPIPYETTIVVEQLNLNGNFVIKECTLFGAWPQSISPLNMEMQARDQYNSFDVTFCFKYTDFEAAG